MTDLQIEEVLENDVFYSFYGVDNNYFKLGSIVFEVLEDPDDGYRSYLDSIPRVNYNGIFHKRPLANVRYSSSTYMHYLTDESGHVWLAFGTDMNEELYPLFVFTYDPAQTTEYATPINELESFDPLMIHAEKLI